MLRRVHDALARLLTGPRADSLAMNDWHLAQEVRVPDPYVWRLPNPSEARWSRWARRSRAVGHRLPLPQEEECWHIPARHTAPLWETADDVVRPYVLRP